MASSGFRMGDTHMASAGLQSQAEPATYLSSSAISLIADTGRRQVCCLAVQVSWR